MLDVDDLLDSIFGGNSQALYAEFEAWVRGSRPFRAFATSYRTKIRAKLRNAGNEEGMQDLRAELATAALLLREERFTVAYETYAALKQRGPDFTVTFKTHTAFNVEVRRIRKVDLESGDLEARAWKLVAVLCDKVAQMPPSIANLLWLVADWEISDAELNTATSILRQLTERKADEFFAHYGYQGATDFARQYSRLSGVVIRQANRYEIWMNPLARHKVPQAIRMAIQRLES